MEDLSVSDGVNSCHDDLLDDGALRELVNVVLVSELHPVLPFIRLGEVPVVENSSSIKLSKLQLVLKLMLLTLDVSVAKSDESLSERLSELGID